MAYVINLDDHKPIGTYWIALCVNVDNITYFNSFGVDEKRNRKKKYYNKYFQNISMCGYYCIKFINFYVERRKFVRLYQFIFS